jgi:hypothetical protein
VVNPEKAASSDPFADHAVMVMAINRAIREAIRRCAQAGQMVASWQDGKVVWIDAQEVLARLAQKEASGAA